MPKGKGGEKLRDGDKAIYVYELPLAKNLPWQTKTIGVQLVRNKDIPSICVKKMKSEKWVVLYDTEPPGISGETNTLATA
jgi:hypothetical protein